MYSTGLSYFFGGVLADFMVQSQIARAREQVDEAISRVSEIHSQLARLLE